MFVHLNNHFDGHKFDFQRWSFVLFLEKNVESDSEKSKSVLTAQHIRWKGPDTKQKSFELNKHQRLDYRASANNLNCGLHFLRIVYFIKKACAIYKNWGKHKSQNHNCYVTKGCLSFRQNLRAAENNRRTTSFSKYQQTINF